MLVGLGGTTVIACSNDFPRKMTGVMEPPKCQHVGIAAVSRPGERWEGKIALLGKSLTPFLADVGRTPPEVESCRDVPTHAAGAARSCPLGTGPGSREEGKHAADQPIRH